MVWFGLLGFEALAQRPLKMIRILKIEQGKGNLMITVKNSSLQDENVTVFLFKSNSFHESFKK